MRTEVAGYMEEMGPFDIGRFELNSPPDGPCDPDLVLHHTHGVEGTVVERTLASWTTYVSRAGKTRAQVESVAYAQNPEIAVSKSAESRGDAHAVRTGGSPQV